MHTTHAGLVFPPLFITMVFCFALVFVQQHQANSRAAATKQAYDKAHSRLSPASLKTIDTLQPIAVSQPSASSATPTTPAASPSSPSSGVRTSAPPQPSKSSGSALQSAAPNTIPAHSIIPVVTQPVNSIVNKLLP